ncbi:MAG: signal peptide peptidase SppA [Gammaproteobacteria bacterium]|nr:MAG: signal peptide peptidase SppA [Gammaproteobacteria bacterium]
MSRPGVLRRFFGGFWAALTWLREMVSNLIFLLILVAVAMLFAGASKLDVPTKAAVHPPKAALLLEPWGDVVDQKTYVPPVELLFSGGEMQMREVLLRDMIESIEFAAVDDSITALVFKLDNMSSLGISKTQELLDAVEVFRATGKPIVAMGDYYSQDQYLFASLADDVFVHPAGGVILEGYGNYRQYYRDALEKLAVNMHVFRAGKHKSYAEPFVRDDMSENEKMVSGKWLESLWSQYTYLVEKNRDFERGALTDYVNQQDVLLEAQNGNMAKMALEAGLVDELMYRSAFNAYMIDVVGAENDDGDYERVNFERYVRHKRAERESWVEDRVVVVTAVGEIVPGEQPPGVIGGDSLAAEIRGAIQDDQVKALVLRVDSGGGSVFASEVIRQAMLDVKARGLPLVVSMGRVAASGGYYISTDADEVWATPSTLTGSIGVFAAFPTVEDLLAKLGVSTDGVGTTELAGTLRVDRPLSAKVAKMAQSSVDYIYRDFVSIVAEGQGMSYEAVDAVAQGRVWSGFDAHEVGLVDKLGTLSDAIASAAALAELDDYEVYYQQPDLSPADRFMQEIVDEFGAVALLGDWLPALAAPVRAAVKQFQVLNKDPGHMYMRCEDCQAL